MPKLFGPTPFTVCVAGKCWARSHCPHEKTTDSINRRNEEVSDENDPDPQRKAMFGATHFRPHSSLRGAAGEAAIPSQPLTVQAELVEALHFLLRCRRRRKNDPSTSSGRTEDGNPTPLPRPALRRAAAYCGRAARGYPPRTPPRWSLGRKSPAPPPRAGSRSPAGGSRRPR